MSFYVTTPIYYANARPHLGHAYTTIAADVAARHMRQRGEDVFFLTGTDEHSSGPVKKAAEEGVDVKAYVDRIASVFRDLTHDLNATNDFFIRTTDAEHKTWVQGLLQRCKDNGDIYEATYAGLYCSSCEAFYTEDDLVDGLCPQHQSRPEWLEERNWFFRLSRYQDALLAHYDANSDFVRPQSKYNEARAFIAAGLDDFSISRSTLSWGIPLPWDPDHVAYVWFDALSNYLSALSYARPGEDLTERFWPVTWHLLGKDILRFHCVYWPAMLLSGGHELPRGLFVHGYLTVRQEKMSKTVGNVLDPFRVIEHYGLDALRYYALRAVRFGQDGDVSYDAVHERYHGELGNDLGNLLQRTVAMIDRYRERRIPDAPTDPAVAAALERARDAFAAHVERFELTDAIEAIWDPIRLLNRYVEEQAPWALAKDAARSDDLDLVLATLADGLRVIAVVLAAVIPDSATRMLHALGAGDDISWSEARPGRTRLEARVHPGEVLFPRVDDPLT